MVINNYVIDSPTCAKFFFTRVTTKEPTMSDSLPAKTYLYVQLIVALGQNYLGPPLKGRIDLPVFFHFLAL